jgi:hypothetical protein
VGSPCQAISIACAIFSASRRERGISSSRPDWRRDRARTDGCGGAVDRSHRRLGKAAEIEARGWEEEDRGDPWVVQVRKSWGPGSALSALIPEGEGGTAEAELREIMGDYWLSADEIATLRK